MLTGVAVSFSTLLALRLLLGLGESTGFPCVSKLLADVVPVAGLGTANGIVGFAYLFGASSPGIHAIAPILAGPQATARWVGIQNAMGNLAGILAPALTGFTIGQTGHFTTAFVLCAAVSLLGLYGWIGMLPPPAALRWPQARGT